MKPETRPSKETFPRRTEPPGEGGLANEVRPGLGTRARQGAKPGRNAKTKPPAEDHDPLGRNAPLPPREPREQPADSRAHEQERDTGVSGHSGAE